MREIWDNLPKSNVGRWAKVVGVHPHVHSVDLVFLDDGTKALAVLVTSPFPASQSFGYSYLPAPDLPTDAKADFVLKPGAKAATSGAQTAADTTSTVTKTASITRGAQPGTTDALPDTGVAEVLQVKQGEKVFLLTADYRVGSSAIDWSPSGAEPVAASKYEVTYRYAQEAKTPTTSESNTAIGTPGQAGTDGVTVIKTVILTRGPFAHGMDLLPDQGVTSIKSVRQGDKIFSGISDYQLTNNSVDWSPLTGVEPVAGTQYTVDYEYRSKASGMATAKASENSPENQQTEARKWSPRMSKTKDIIALVQYIGGIAVVTGFLPPRVDDLGFDARAYPDLEIKRHSGGGHVVTTGDGAVELYDPSRGVRVSIAEEGKDGRLDLAGKDFQKRFKSKANTKKGVFVVGVGADATVVRIKKCGVEIETLGRVAITASCGVVVNGKVYADDVIGGGVSLKNHKHGGIEPGGGLTAKAESDTDTPGCGCG